jgi:membrane-associated phospholipid phosphatase
VFVGAHWPLDIVGGAAVGIICGFLVHLLLKSDTEKIYQQKTPHPGNI